MLSYDVDLRNLNQFMQKIIKVLNQHAKLLDQQANEIKKRPNQIQVGELFAMISMGFQYDRIIS